MRTATKSAFLCLASLACLVLLAGCVQPPASGGGAAAAAPKLEHFVCSDFDVDERPLIEAKALALKDQFGGFDAKVRLIAQLCAPAVKFHDGKYHVPRDFGGPHLACYELRGAAPDIEDQVPVRIFNQFENRGLKGEVGKRRLVCVPSGKVPFKDGKPPSYDHDREVRKAEAALDHFVCSDFWPDETDFHRNRMGVFMGDQFGPFEGRIRAPNLLCAPAEKNFEGRRVKPHDGFNGDHLACYFFVPYPAVGLPFDVAVPNQLDRPAQQGKPTQRHMFCVPTKKIRL